MSTPAVPIYTVDAFTDRPFAGNPAAVCLLAGPADDGWLQAVAAEMNLSETAFLEPAADGYKLRWLTPAVEVDLCGHATLASAHVLWETGRLAPTEPARFHTRSGLLTATRRGDDIVLDFPARPAEPCPVLGVGRSLRRRVDQGAKQADCQQALVARLEALARPDVELAVEPPRRRRQQRRGSLGQRHRTGRRDGGGEQPRDHRQDDRPGLILRR